jgi:hypothetical protein
MRFCLNSKLKKYWLLSSILYFVSLLVDAFTAHPYMYFELTLGSLILLIPFGYLFIESLNFTGLFLFSYKKNGTVLLTSNMILTLIRMGVATSPLWLWESVSTTYANQPASKLLIDSLVSALYFLTLLQWFIFSYKLRSANKLAKKNELLSQPEHQSSMQELQAVTDLEELAVKYGASVRNYPQIAGVLKEIYKRRKIELRDLMG